MADIGEKMRDESREQFEAWVKSKWPETDLGQFNDGEYCGFTLQHCWSAWQASRQAVVVELPVNVSGGLYSLALEDCKHCIEAQGLRVGVRK